MTRLCRLGGLALVVISLAPGRLQAWSPPTRQVQPPPSSRAPADLEGVWKAEAMEANGRPAPAALVEGVEFRFIGETLVLAGFGGGGPEQKCRFTIDDRTAPGRLDFTPEGGRTVFAIYQLTGEGADRRLTVIFTRNGDAASRPTDFATTPGSNRLKIVLRRTPHPPYPAYLAYPAYPAYLAYPAYPAYPA